MNLLPLPTGVHLLSTTRHGPGFQSSAKTALKPTLPHHTAFYPKSEFSLFPSIPRESTRSTRAPRPPLPTVMHPASLSFPALRPAAGWEPRMAPDTARPRLTEARGSRSASGRKRKGERKAAVQHGNRVVEAGRYFWKSFPRRLEEKFRSPGRSKPTQRRCYEPGCATFRFYLHSFLLDQAPGPSSRERSRRRRESLRDAC